MASRQAGTHLPSGEGSNTPQASPLLSPGEEDGPMASQAGLGAHLPSGEGSNTPQASHLLSPGEEDGPRASQAGLGTHLPSGEGSNSSPQAIAHLPPGKGSNYLQATAHLPPREGSSSSQATAHLPTGEAGSSSQATAHLPPGKAGSFFPGNYSSFPGKDIVIPSQVRQAIKLGQAGRASGVLPGIGHPRLPRRIVLPLRQTALTPRKATTPLPPNRLPQGSSNEDPNPKWAINLSNKPLTPAQRSVLAKGPNFVVAPKQPPNLEYITAIEAACTKLSQQDAKELRADINRVLR